MGNANLDPCIQVKSSLGHNGYGDGLHSRWCDLHATYTAWINNQGDSSVTHKGFENQGVQIDHTPVVGNQGGTARSHKWG